MSFQLVIYSNKAFKEYLLPAVNNADHLVHLSRNLFAAPDEMEIKMEVVDNCWYFLDSEKYSITDMETGVPYEHTPLHDKQLFSICFWGNITLSAQIVETTKTFTVFTKYDISYLDNVTIGRSEENDIVYSASNLVKRQAHAVLWRTNNYWVIEDRSENGVYINSVMINGGWQLGYGDCIKIFGLCIIFLDDCIAVNDRADGVAVNTGRMRKKEIIIGEPAAEDAASMKKVIYHRSPRQIYKLDSEPVEIEAPPQPGQENKRPLLMTIGPSLTMAIPMMLGSFFAIMGSKANGSAGSSFMFTGLITAVSSALIGTMWAITNIRYEKKHHKEEETHRFEAYGEYLIRCANEIKEKYDRNTNNLKRMYPDAAECCGYTENTPWLWNRNSSHADYLSYRLGIGDLPFQVAINVPKERFTMVNDSLSERPQMIRDSYKTLHDVPVCIDLLKRRLVGVIGGKDKLGAKDVVYNLVTQIAVSNCYTDVKMVFIYDETEEEEESFRFAKWLPHVWSEDKKTRFVAGNKNDASDVLYEVTKALRIRMENDNSSRDKEIPKPYYILFVSDPELLEGEMISSYIYKGSDRCGLSTVMMVESYEELPNVCNYVIENDQEFCGMYDVTDNMEERIAIHFDHVTEKQMEWFARNLSNIEVNESETGGEMPNSLDFFEMYGISRLEELNVMERWRKNRTYDSMRALIGQKSGGADCYLDIHEKYHGPHGLIAGTTGSGKSETLQTYILSLALNFSPDDVGFFLIDYKGGGMANLFDGLPHILGQISNLSGNQVRRAMVSIKSENKRRQRIFNEHGVNNINLYTKLVKNNEASIPVPHMFIVIDEFAELKREEPEFMKELISVAQVGRSLGVHLILATQKPSGTVDDNIWSNSKFRLCLRVQDRQDSNDMLHRPDAAYITQAGRCYMQVGNDELFELFQSGYSGAAYDEEAGGQKTDIALMISDSGKAALVGNHLKKKQKDAAKTSWISKLVNCITEVTTDDRDVMKNILGEKEKAEEILAKIFSNFARHGIEYPENEYNTQRVRNLMEAYYRTGSVEELLAYAELKRLKLPEMKEKTQLDAVVEYLHKVAIENNYVNQLQLWLPVLPTQLYLKDLSGYRVGFDGKKWAEKDGQWHIEVPIGLYDDPVNQAQDTLSVNFSDNGHHVIVGVVGSGKSTFLQTLAYALVNQYTPDEINIYALDFSSKMMEAFIGMPHVGGVVYEGEEEKLSKFFTMMSGIMEERKKLFKGGNYSQYVRVHGIVLPTILVFIDNYANFRNKSAEMYDDMVLQIVKDGGGLGIYLVVTGGGFGSLEIPTRIADNIRTSISLEMSDKFQYSEVMRMTHLEVLPEVNVKGRGLAKVGDDVLEFQTAMTFPTDDDFRRMEEIEKIGAMMSEAWQGKKAKAIPEIPEKPIWDEFALLDDVQAMAKEGKSLPVGYNAKNASVYGLDLSGFYCLLVSGKVRTGKTNFLKTAIMAASLMENVKITLIDFGTDFRNLADKNGMDVIDSDEKLFEFFKNLMPDFVERNKKKKQNLANGMSDEELVEDMFSFPTRFIFLSSLTDFVKHVTKPAEGVGSMSGFVENILDKGIYHNVFWMAASTQEESSRMTGTKIYDYFIRDKKGIHFGGDVSAQRILDFSYVPFSEQSKGLKPGIGMLPVNDKGIGKVVVPLYKG